MNEGQTLLPVTIPAISDQRRLIESDAFPIEFLSDVARRESWRKEIYRPIYHVHKWWAKRLGSVFRGILLGCLLPEDADLKDEFYQKQNFVGIIVLDPFMGSGTTIGEAHKLGCTSLGRDINPVACESVRVALNDLDPEELKGAFAELSQTVGKKIGRLYKAEDESGQECDTLYYFWVKQVPCLYCGSIVDLFSSHIFARNAYPDRKPEVQICCPQCGEVFPGLNTDKSTACPSCDLVFNPHSGFATRTKAICGTCHKSFSIIDAVRELKEAPEHRQYAKLLLKPDGEKQYLAVTHKDVEQYERCSVRLQEEVERGAICLPNGNLTDGYNTRQAINYNYRAWRDFFNDRQLLALGWLQEAISRISNEPARDALFVLFSGLLEFNNLFASYKGEGTGAVRHMFSHHILKPERMPIEANVWGTPKSSGSFSTLFKTRLIRAARYQSSPFEVTIDGSGKAHRTSEPLSGKVRTEWPVDGNFTEKGVYLSCASSKNLDLPDNSVDLVVTDPPFFDNVHYSELADFFYAWQSRYPRGFIMAAPTTRHPEEVQDVSADHFAAKLEAVFAECHRVLKDDGCLVFTYHHSRTEGWLSLVNAVVGAGFFVSNAHPVKSEMSVAAPKAQTKEPIQLDIVLVCKKLGQDLPQRSDRPEILDSVVARAFKKIDRLESVGLRLSQNDRRVVILSQLISEIRLETSDEAVQAFSSYMKQFEDLNRDQPNFEAK